MIFGPEDDGTYVAEFRTAEGDAPGWSRRMTAWLGRQDSNLCIRNRARLGLPLSCGAPDSAGACTICPVRKARTAVKPVGSKFLRQKFESCR